MKRRTWLQQAGLLFAGLSMQSTHAATKIGAVSSNLIPDQKQVDERSYWVSVLEKMANPIFENISKGTFQKNMPMIVSSSFDGRNPKVGYLEAFGRLIAGIAPWLALPDDNTSEGKLRKKYREQTIQGLIHGVDPNSPDYFAWRDKSSQTLVDAAHLALAFMRAPKAIWDPLPQKTKDQLITEFKHIRWIKPGPNNWILFAAMTESFLYSVGVEPERTKIDHAVDTFDTEWYVGDGWYSDGKSFSFDYYNGYVIHCMLVETLRQNLKAGNYQEKYDRAYMRMQRYATHLERMISPDGYYPVIGRSSTYRNGGFQPLAQVALEKKLPKDLKPGQVRAGLTAIMKNIYQHNIYDKHGWLVLGFTSDKQGNLADYYTNVGSLYEASLAFLPLGLPASDEFWSSPAEKWTSQKAFSGEVFPKDYYVTY